MAELLPTIAFRIKSAELWLKSAWSEPDGTGSSTRIHVSLLIAFVLGVGISFAVLVHQHHISIEQFDAFLLAGGTFIATTCGTLYGANKLADWAKDRNANSPEGK